MGSLRRKHVELKEMPRNGRGCTPRATGADVRPRPLPNLTSFQDTHGQGFCNTVLDAMIRQPVVVMRDKDEAMDDEQKRIERNLAKLAVTDTGTRSRTRPHRTRSNSRGFSGMFDDLEAALGVLRIGHHLGWRVLVLIHNKRTIRKYEEILGIDVREFFPAEGPSCERSIGYVDWPRSLAISGRPSVAPSRLKIAA